MIRSTVSIVTTTLNDQLNLNILNYAQNNQDRNNWNCFDNISK